MVERVQLQPILQAWGCTEILDTLIYKRLLDTQEITDLVHSEVLLIEKFWDPSFQSIRNSMWRHNNMYMQTIRTRFEPMTVTCARLKNERVSTYI